jgi:hypothetical protein
MGTPRASKISSQGSGECNAGNMFDKMSTKRLMLCLHASKPQKRVIALSTSTLSSTPYVIKVVFSFPSSFVCMC